MPSQNENAFSMYRDHMNSSVLFAKEIIRYSFIINGVAGTSILAAGMALDIKPALICFSIGAFCSCIACIFAYLYQHSVALDWQKKRNWKWWQRKSLL